jgi:predicted SprT family Zn-dependent metalloprotease
VRTIKRIIKRNSYIYFVSGGWGSSGTYDDATDIIVINEKSIACRIMLKQVIRHELRHFIWHLQNGKHNVWMLDWVKCELFAFSGWQMFLS